MVVLVQEIDHGNMRGYMGALPLSVLRANVAFALPAGLKHLQPWLEEEEKVVDGIAMFVEKSISHGEPWPLGCLIIGLYYQQPEQKPRFQAYTQQQGVEKNPRYGTVEIDDVVMWIPIDGSQRLRGMFKALNTLTWQREALAQSLIPVLFLPLSDSEQVQELIIRMHKSARAVTRGETIRTALEDRYSIYARWLKGDDEPAHPGVISEKLVNWKSNTITNRLRQFTTLSTLYDSAEILDQAFGGLFSFSDEQSDERYLQIYEVWKLLLGQFDLFKQALSGPTEQLPSLREAFLCMRPTGQLIIIHVLAFAIREQVSLNNVIKRLGAVPWDMSNSIWQDMIIVEGRVNGRAAATLVTAKLVAYLIGIPLSNYELQVLSENYKRGKEALPTPLFEPLERSDDLEARKRF